MAYTLDFALDLGPAKAGLSDLRAQLVDTAGSNTGSAVTTGFTEIGSGRYLWHYASFPDGHRGGVKFYSNAAPSTILAFASLNPEEAENSDVKTSTRSTLDAAGVWAHGTRTLTSFGTLVSDIWSHGTRTLTSFGTLIANIWANASRTITGGAIDTNNDKTGYELSPGGVQAVWDVQTSDLGTVGSVGEALADNVDAPISTRSTLDAAGVWDAATSALTTAGSIGEALADNVDAPISTRSSHSAADVWSSDTRTLTSFGTLVTSIWTYATRTLTSGGGGGGATAQEIWEYEDRQLTSFGTLVATIWSYVPRTLTQALASLQSAITGPNLTITQYVTFDAIELPGIEAPVGWERCYFTVKGSLGDPDEAAIVQIVVTDPDDPGDGLIRLNGEATTAAWGELVVDDSVLITLHDDATALLCPVAGLRYDVKFVTDAGKSVLVARGLVDVVSTPTAAIE